MKNNNIRKKIFTLLLLIFSIIFSLAVLEVSTRFYLFGWNNLSIDKIKSVRFIGESGMIEASPFPEVVYEFKKNINSYYKLAELRINSVGMRDREYPLKKPERTFRVAVIGDSVSTPAGVELDDAFHKVLEDRLNSKAEGITYEFMNFAVPGYNLRQYLGVIRDKAITYAPDLFIIGFIWNDCKVPLEEMFNKSFVPRRTADNFYSSFALRLFKRLFDNRDIMARSNMPVSNEEAEYLDDMFYKIKDFSREHDIPVVVVFLSIRKKEGVGIIEEKIRKNGLYFFDAASSIRGSKDYKIYPIDDHPNDKAHRIFADHIYDYLVDKQFVHRGSFKE